MSETLPGHSGKEFDIKELQQHIGELSAEELERSVERSGDRRKVVQLVEDHSNRIITQGGKRFRIMLEYLTARAQGTEYSDRELVRAALPVELDHGWSLEIDDINDDDDERRGFESLHRYMESQGFDEETGKDLAMVEAVFMNATSTDAFLDLDFLSYEDRVRIGKIITEAEKDLARGQQKDIVSAERSRRKEFAEDMLSRAGEEYDSRESYEEIVLEKTWPLFRASVEIGNYLGGVEDEAVEQYSRELALAFQKRDDAIDFYPAEDSGKDQYSDLAEGTITLVTDYVLQELEDSENTGLADWEQIAEFDLENCGLEDLEEVTGEYESREQFLRDVLAEEDPVEERVELAGAVVRGTGAIERVNTEAMGHAEQAADYLGETDLRDPYGEALEELAFYAATRSK
ncbi:MAG: polyprenyl synthetase family protein [Candidatus Nanohaloarchaea archaeon]